MNAVDMRTPSAKTLTLIATKDEALNKRVGWQENQLAKWLRDLMQFGQVEVGWRESCGTTDATMHQSRAWFQVVKSLQKDGFVLIEERQKHGNSWATKGGGFWGSIVYKLEVAA